jgi:hypothetical protein
VHERAEARTTPGDRVVVDLGGGEVAVTHLVPVRERVSLARSRELVLFRLMALGISPATLRILLPERRELIDRIAA